MATKLADEFITIALHLAEIEADAQLLCALPPGVTVAPPRQRELSVEELSKCYLATP